MSGIVTEQDALRNTMAVLAGMGVSGPQFQAWLAPLNKTVVLPVAQDGGVALTPVQNGPVPDQTVEPNQPPQGQRSRGEIKALLQNGPVKPVIDAVRHPEVAAQFADACSKFDAQRDGVLSQIGDAAPEAKPLDLNEAYDRLLASHASLAKDVKEAVEGKEKTWAEDSARIKSEAQLIKPPEGAEPAEQSSLATAVALVATTLDSGPLSGILVKAGSDALLAAQSELTRVNEQILKRKEEKKRREEAVAAEVGKVSTLNSRIDALTKGSFGVQYLRAKLALVRPPKSGDKTEKIDERDAGRALLEEDVKIAEDFRRNVDALRVADKAIELLGPKLRDGFKASRPDVPASTAGAGIATEDDFNRIKANAGKVTAWIDTTANTSTYTTTLDTVGKLWKAQKADAWPALAATAMAGLADQAETKAGEQAKAGASLDPAIQILTDGKASIEAGARYVPVMARVKDKRSKLPPEVALLGGWIDMLTKTIDENAAPSASDFTTSEKELTNVEVSIALGIQYATALKKTQADLTEVKRLVTPGTKDAAAKADAEIQKDIDAAASLADGFEYGKAMDALKKADTAIADASVQREKAVTDRAGALVKGKVPQEAILTAVGGSKDSGGKGLAAELYLQFGETDLPRLLAGMTGAKPGATAGTPDATGLAPDVTANNLKALGASVGAKGLKDLTAAFGGSTNAAFGGADKLGQTMKHGMNAGQVGDLHTTYDLGKPAGVNDLKQVIDTSFRGDPQVFAAITSQGLNGPPQTGPQQKDKCVGNLKAMTDAFNDPAKLRTLIDGVKSDDSTTGLSTANFNALNPNEKGLLKTEQCATAAKRMDNLVTNHFKGDAKKLKDPFFDQLEKQPGAEYNALLAARQASQDYQGLSVQAKKGKQPPVYTQQMAARLARLANVNTGGAPIGIMVRTAATLEMKPAPSEAPVFGGLACTGERAKHFEERHCRLHATLAPPALAPDTTPAGDEKDVPMGFWPEGTTAANIKTLVVSVLQRIGPPPAGWAARPTTTYTNPKGVVTQTTFYQYDDFVSYPFTSAGKNFTSNVGVRLGVEVKKTTTPGAKQGDAPKVETTRNLTQFFPKEDTRQFEDMQTIKAALGKRLPSA